MKKWNVIIEHEEKELEVIIKAMYYSDAFVEAETAYPGCRVKNITQIQEEE